MSTELDSSGVRRRGFLGYLGSATAGAVVGAGAGFATARAGEEGRVSTSAPSGLGREISPWGAHQPGVAAHPSSFTELVALDLTSELRRSADVDALARLLRVWTGDVEAFTRGRGAPGDTAPWLVAADTDLTITVGLGPRLFTTAWGIEAPAGFGRVPAMKHDELDDAWSGGDLFVAVSGRDGTTVGHVVRRMVADATPWARQRWRQSGSWNGYTPSGEEMTGRNVFGQVDGSANPRPGTDLFDTTVWIRDGVWAGGTSLVVRRIRMDLPVWDTLTRSEQEGSVGRDLPTGAPLTGGEELDDVRLSAKDGERYVINPLAHVRRSHPSTHGGRRIFRKGANYETTDGRTSEAGLIFSSYQADLLDQFVPIQQMLDEGDELNEWTTAIGSAEFAVLPGFVEGEWLGQRVLGL
ncbi:Dyp-type peroxidase [Nocardioides yefusunii]|uniref:Dyp-type peroxidase n=1 Tax=Nocardioides yefusunii TaxID=2500546 RepID=A0ABW1QZ22_9ACTN|nr:Dyp-type peroxidase [Nocardioides yefusunii]